VHKLSKNSESEDREARMVPQTPPEYATARANIGEALYVHVRSLALCVFSETHFTWRALSSSLNLQLTFWFFRSLFYVST